MRYVSLFLAGFGVVGAFSAVCQATVDKPLLYASIVAIVAWLSYFGYDILGDHPDEEDHDAI